MSEEDLWEQLDWSLTSDYVNPMSEAGCYYDEIEREAEHRALEDQVGADRHDQDTGFPYGMGQ